MYSCKVKKLRLRIKQGKFVETRGHISLQVSRECLQGIKKKLREKNKKNLLNQENILPLRSQKKK